MEETFIYDNMEKRLLFILALLMIAFGASAGPVNKQMAQSKAKNFMARKGLSTKATPALVAKKANGDAAFYVYNATGKQGFVIIAGDDRSADVLGYVEQGEFDAANIPENMQAWLDGYRAELEAADLAAAPALEGEEPARENIPMMLSTLWNQNEPYNRLCPLNNNTRTYTGCVATALAQIMKYYQYPERTTKPIAGYQFSTYNTYFWKDFDPNGLPDTTFVYDKMRNYYAGDEPASTKDAVALLMQYAGYAVQTSYSTTFSGATIGSPVNALKEYFDYDANIRLVARSSYSATQWDELIYNEMVAKRPVLISGMSETGTGHEFVCDGYKDGLYHFNWGWGGYCDGYFRLSALSPSGSGIGGSTNILDGYNRDVMAVVGIQPNTHTSEAEEIAPICTSFYFDGDYVRLTLVGYQPQTINYAFGIGYYQEDGTLTQISNMITNTLKNGIAVSYPYSIDIVKWQCNEPGRNYKIVPIYAIVDGGTNGSPAPAGTEWKSCAPYGVYINFCADASGEIQVDRFPQANLSVKGVTISGPLTAKAQTKVTVILHNNGDEFDDNIALYVAAPGCIPLLADGGKHVVGADTDQGIEFNFTPTRQGTYTLYTVHGTEGFIIDQSTIEIKGMAQSTILAIGADGTSMEDKDGKTLITFQVRNVGGARFNGTIFADLYRVIGTTSVREVSQETEQDILPGQTVEITLEYDYLSAGKYQIRLANETPGGAKNNGFATYDFTIEEKEEQSEDGVRSVTFTGSNAPYYTTGGIQQQEPTGAGLYIHNGKKELHK